MDKLTRKGMTITETLVAGVVAILIFASAIGAFLLTRNTQSYGLAEYNLQRDTVILMNRIIRNIREGADSSGLRSARSFAIPNASELDYTDATGTVRKYLLNGNSIIYESPDRWPQQSSVFTAPAGGAVTLRFWEPAGYLDHETAGIYIGITKQVGSRTVSGSVSTYVNIRNVPK